ncbi:MAG: hypothetical protein M1833_002205 [Piccolia ochrophora]|nr:MAG: hypothetical protein M1833_002205 [Piccolia ochrophora]
MGFLEGIGFKHYPLNSDSPEFEDLLQDRNELNTVIFYSYVAFVFFSFLVTRLLRHLYLRNRHLRKETRLLARPSRLFRQWCIRKAFYPFATRGHMLVIVGYLIINVAVCSWRVRDMLQRIQLARRTGWMSAINFSLVILLSMKNTPLSKLTGFSYEHLNVFHRWVAMTALIQGGVHTIAIALGTAGLVPSQTHILIEWENIMGIVAFACWAIMMVSFPLLRKHAYEWFYVLHMILFPAVTVSLFLHNKYCRVPVLVALGLYGADRLIRSDRYLWHNRHARQLKATLTATEDGSTLVSVPRGHFHWRSGSHAFLNIPRLRYFQSHPFTIASVGDDASKIGEKNNVEFLIKPKNGFTKALYEEAKKSELRRGFTKDVTAYIDGPYGSVANFGSFDRVVLIAAGSGVTFTLPIALSLVRQDKVKSVDFIWSVRNENAIKAIEKQLWEIASHSNPSGNGTYVNMRLQITGKTKIQRKPTTVQRLMSKAKREPQRPYQYDLYESSFVSLGFDGTSTPPNAFTVGGTCISPPPSGHRSRAGSDTTLLSRRGFQSPGVRPPFVPGHAKNDSYDSTICETTTLVDSDAVSFKPPIKGIPEVAVYECHSQPQTPEILSIRSPSPSPPMSGPEFPLGFATKSGRGMTPRVDIADDDDSSSVEEDEKGLGRVPPMPRDGLARFYVAGRPDIPGIISSAIETAADDDTIAVGACGVTAMTDEVRATVADRINARGPSLSVFCEEFGW